MKKAIILILIGLVLVSGCATGYVFEKCDKCQESMKCVE